MLLLATRILVAYSFPWVRSAGGACVVAHPLPTYHRRVSEEPSFLYLVSPLLVVVGILGLFSLSWALRTRPSWGQVRNELYGFLLFAGAVAVVIAFSFLALNYFPGPDWFWFLVGFVGLFWMVFLIHQKFDSSRI